MIKNEEKHWNSIAHSYEEEVLDVYRSNKKKKLQKQLKKISKKAKKAIDFGCGIGNGFKYISPLFKEILAVDISTNCLRKAQSLGYKNIGFAALDLTQENLSLPKTDVVICCNVAILPGDEKNEIIFTNIEKSLTKKGWAVIVVPAVESALHSAKQLIKWYAHEGISSQEVTKEELNLFHSEKDVYQGMVDIDGVITKHYLKEELEASLRNAKLNIQSLKKLEYSWDTEFNCPPMWMGSPYPWDWMAVCQKK